MGIDVARIGDIGLGFCYGNDCDDKAHDGDKITGTIVVGASNVNANGINVARIGDILISDCSHKNVGRIITGSPTVNANGLSVARIGDTFIGCFGDGDPNGILLTGSPNVYGG